MSYLEILWIIGVVVFPILFTIFLMFIAIDYCDFTEMDDEDLLVEMIGKGLLVGIFLWVFLVGGVGHMISDGINDYVITSEFETTPKFVELTSEKLVMMSDEGEIFTYNDYKDIRRLSDGGKFYKVYKYKKCFGPDSNTFNVIVK